MANEKSVELMFGDPIILEVQEAAAGSANDFYSGDIVSVNSDGELIIGATNAVPFGIAMKSATGTASTKIPVILIDPGHVYSMKYKASATAESLIGQEADIVYTAGAHTIDEASAGDNQLDIVGLDSRDAVTTSGGRLLVRFRSAALIDTH